MEIRSFLLGAAALAGAALSPSAAWGSTGVCDSNPPTTTTACINAIQNGGSVVNDIFKDANGVPAQQLPLFGKLYNQWPGCDGTCFAGCSGVSHAPFDCPGQYNCIGLPDTFANASTFLNALDRQWWHPCRLSNHNLVNGCPAFGSCIADGTGGSYFPWEGVVFDLGGPSNKVAIFAENDHGPQPCESTEYTVFLSDNPLSKELIADPKTSGVDPQKWNRAVLSTIYTKGFVEIRPPDPAGHANCGDTALYSVEEDSFVSVYSLPCGITFRYAAIVAGNDGLDFPACAFDSSEAELDAVAGLTESGAAVCPDADGDHFVDCKCPGAPPVCDCNDGNPNIHPGAPEACDSPDVNCDGIPGACANPMQICYQSLCLDTCGGENPVCPPGANCSGTPKGQLCVPQDCSVGGCPPGGVCKNGLCVPACDAVVCPYGQTCQDGQCINLCNGVQCPAGQLCQDGACVFPCGCYSGDVGCVGQPGTVCDKTAMNGACVPPACVGKMCPMGQICNPINGVCIDFCNGVKCPVGEACQAPVGCVPICQTVMCMPGFTCNMMTGTCEDHSCDNITCLLPEVCVMGACTVPDGGSAGGAGGMGGAGGHGEATSTGTASSSHGGGGSGGSTPGQKGRCGCRVAGEPADSAFGAAAALLAAMTAIGRRRCAAQGRSRRTR